MSFREVLHIIAVLLAKVVHPFYAYSTSDTIGKARDEVLTQICSILSVSIAFSITSTILSCSSLIRLLIGLTFLFGRVGATRAIL